MRHRMIALEDPDLRDRVARAYTQIEYTRLLNYRALSKILKGEPNWPEVPLAKLQWSSIAQSLAELALDEQATLQAEPVGERISLAFRVKPAQTDAADPYR